MGKIATIRFADGIISQPDLKGSKYYRGSNCLLITDLWPKHGLHSLFL